MINNWVSNNGIKPDVERVDVIFEDGYPALNKKPEIYEWDKNNKELPKINCWRVARKN